MANQKVGPPGQGYLHKPASNEVLGDLDRKYAAWDQGRPAIFANTTNRGREACWAEHQNGRIKAISVRGKLWALALLINQKTNTPRTAAELASEILKAPRAAEDQRFKRVEQALGRRWPPEGALKALISEFTRNYCPDYSSATLLLELTSEYAKGALLEGAKAARTAFDRELAKPIGTIQACYSNLEQIIDRSGKEGAFDDETDMRWLDAVGTIDTRVAHDLVQQSDGGGIYLYPPRDDDPKDVCAAAIRDVLQRPRPRFIVISGEPFVGKKAKLKAALRELTKGGNRPVVSLPPSRPGLPAQAMPIAVWTGNGIHYGALVERVATFLRHYHEAKPRSHGSLTPLPPCPSFNDVEAVLEWIYRNCNDLPAVFVFTDTDAFRRDHARNAVRDLGINKLVDALLATSTYSRVIITTGPLPDDPDDRAQLLGFQKHEQVVVPRRLLSQFKTLISDFALSKLPEDFFDRSSDGTIRGDDLIAVSAVINLGSSERADRTKFDAMAGAVRDFLDETHDAREEGRTRVYDALVDQIADQKLLHAIALVASSEDGVRSDTIRSLLGIWGEYDTDAHALARKDVDAELTRFMGAAGRRFLKRGPIPRYDPEEYDYGEEHGPADKVWEVETTVSDNLLAAIRRRNKTLVHRSHRLIAWVARRRAQTKKVNMRGPLAARASDDAARDIQCYVNLLASMELSDRPQSVEGMPLRLSETEIFSLGSAFQPARALRFAVFSLLQEDIDHDHRLTMVFDEDALRLEMYQLLFQPLGTLHLTHTKPLVLPEKIPRHLLSGAFSDEELLGIMTTVGLSAFHAQQFATLDRIVKLAQKFADERLPEPDAWMVRLQCCRIDAMILLGGKIGGGGNHAETLAEVRELVPAANRCASPAMSRSRLRLLAREAELRWLVEGDVAPVADLYRQIEQGEAAFVDERGRHDPTVLAGRVARRYIRYLLDGVVRNASGTAKQKRLIRNYAIAKAAALISVNQSRLRRFSGADRVGVMLDLSRLRAAQGDLDSALEYARTAHRRASAGNASHASKLDMLGVLAQACLNVIQRDLEAGGMPASLRGRARAEAIASLRGKLKTAAIAALEMLTIAKSGGYRPAEAVAMLLVAQVYLVEARCMPTAERQSRLQQLDPDELLKDARVIMNGIKDTTHASTIAAVRAELAKFQASLKKAANRKSR